MNKVIILCKFVSLRKYTFECKVKVAFYFYCLAIERNFEPLTTFYMNGISLLGKFSRKVIVQKMVAIFYFLPILLLYYSSFTYF